MALAAVLMHHLSKEECLDQQIWMRQLPPTWRSISTVEDFLQHLVISILDSRTSLLTDSLCFATWAGIAGPVYRQFAKMTSMASPFMERVVSVYAAFNSNEEYVKASLSNKEATWSRR